MEGKRHYPDFITCDFCGRSTYGIVYKKEPNIVRCTSCHMELTDVESSVAENGQWKTCKKEPKLYKIQKKLFS